MQAPSESVNNSGKNQMTKIGSSGGRVGDKGCEWLVHEKSHNPKVTRNSTMGYPNTKRKTLPCSESSLLRAELDLRIKENDRLALRLQEERAESSRKDVVIRSMREQLAKAAVGDPKSMIQRQPSDFVSVDSYLSSFSVRDAVEEIQRWMFMEGGHLMGVEEMISEYCQHVQTLGVPLDRLFVGGVMLHPQVSAYVWKWEDGRSCEGHEMPREKFKQRKTLLSPDEPFTVLYDGRADSVRMRSTDPVIPPGCQWFSDGGYQDYLALPMEYRGEFVGAMAWATKCSTGFSIDQIEFFQRSLAALSTIMRLHTNDLVMKTLMGRLEDEVVDRTRELAAANAELEAANRQIVQQSATQLKHFAMMSHEIRTPLNCIIGMSSLLEGSDLDQDQRESLRMIIRSGDLLASVVNDVLDYSRLESGNLDIVMTPISLRDTIGTVVKAMEIKSESREMEIHAHVATCLPEVIQMDSNRLQQILYNLLGNAIKFSGHGGTVDFSVGLCNDKIRFVVKDYGKGIDKKDLGNIFEPFSQGSEESLQAVYGGTGLGLAITRKLVKGLGGTISADSVLGEWSEFVITLPLCKCSEDVSRIDPSVRASPSARADEAPSLQNANPPRTLQTGNEASRASSSERNAAVTEGSDLAFERTRVLIAEDNKINQKILQRILQRLGVGHIDVVENGQEAVNRESSQTYDVLLMDIQMPVMDGIEATKRIISRPRDDGKSAPKIVFVTAHVLDTFRQLALDAGGCNFISKPFNVQKIRTLFLSLTSTCR